MDIRLSDIMHKNSITLVANINGKKKTREIVFNNDARKTLQTVLTAFFDTNKISRKDGILDEKEQAAFFNKLTALHLANSNLEKQPLTEDALSIMKKKLFGKNPAQGTAAFMWEKIKVSSARTIEPAESKKTKKAAAKTTPAKTHKENQVDFSFLRNLKESESDEKPTFILFDKKTGKKVEIVLPNLDVVFFLFAALYLFFDTDHNEKLSAEEKAVFCKKITESIPEVKGYIHLTEPEIAKIILKYYPDKINIGALTEGLCADRSEAERLASQEMLRGLGLYGKKEIKDKILKALTTALGKCRDRDQQAAIVRIFGDIDKDGKSILLIIDYGKYDAKIVNALSVLGFSYPDKIIPRMVRSGISYVYISGASERYDTETERAHAIRDIEERAQMAKALTGAFVKIGAPAIKYLLDALEPPPKSCLITEARRAVIKIITSILDYYENKENRGILCKCGGSSKYKYESDHVIAEISPHSKIIAESLKSNNPKQRVEAMNLLMRFKLNKDMLGYIELALSDTEPEVCRKAANTAGKMNIPGNIKIIESLKNLLKNPHKDVQTEAVRALKKISWNCVEDILKAALTTADPNVRINIINILNGFSGTELKAAVPHFIKMLKYTQPTPDFTNGREYIFFTKEDQGAAARLLIKAGPYALTALTNEISEAKRTGKLLPISMNIYIAEITGEVGKKHPKSLNNELRSYLRYMASGKSGLFARAREATVTALGKIKEGADLLLDCYLNDKDKYVRDKSYKALINMGYTTLPDIVMFLNNSKGDQNADSAKIAKTLVNLITEIAKKNPDKIESIKTQLQAISNDAYPAMAYFKKNSLARLETIKPKIIVRNQ